MQEHVHGFLLSDDVRCDFLCQGAYHEIKVNATLHPFVFVHGKLAAVGLQLAVASDNAKFIEESPKLSLREWNHSNR